MHNYSSTGRWSVNYVILKKIFFLIFIKRIHVHVSGWNVVNLWQNVRESSWVLLFKVCLLFSEQYLSKRLVRKLVNILFRKSERKPRLFTLRLRWKSSSFSIASLFTLCKKHVQDCSCYKKDGGMSMWKTYFLKIK